MERHPVIYEINTWVWLSGLTEVEGRPVTLADVPESVWDNLGSLGIDYVWLMGVWCRSDASREIAATHPDLQDEFDAALPGRTGADVIGSAYAVRDYSVDPHLGGSEGLKTARNALSRRGMGLLLDFVPNHVAVDHPWVREAPECLVTMDGGARPIPRGAFRTGSHVVAHGRDPYFPPWTDTAQLNAYSAPLRQRAGQVLIDIADQCDGVRCDMAMLMLNEVFGWTWSGVAGVAPEREFWTEVIQAVRTTHPNFRFLAEAYWDMEHRLLELGFDWAYDKTFYERLVRGDSGGLRKHVEGTYMTHGRLAKFTENHDEPRAMTAFGRQRLPAANVVAALMPGVWLVHEGQLEGRTVRCPVQLGRRAEEAVDETLTDFYRRLLSLRLSPALRDGRFQSLKCRGWHDNSSNENLLAWLREADGGRFVIVVNLSNRSSQGRIPLPWTDLEVSDWLLLDELKDESYGRPGDELRAPGLFVDLPPWGFHVLKLQRA